MLFIKTLVTHPLFFVLTTVIVVFSICCHEYAHARVALWMGDSTAADRGHLTLNPFKQMGIISLIMFLILGFAWGAVPVNPQQLRSRYSWGELATSLAGPAANLILFCIGWISFGLMMTARESVSENLLLMAAILCRMNCILLLFNLLPVPGLDGWNAFRSLFPNIRVPNTEAVKGILVFLIFAALYCSSWISEFSMWVLLQSVKVFS